MEQEAHPGSPAQPRQVGEHPEVEVKLGIRRRKKPTPTGAGQRRVRPLDRPTNVGVQRMRFRGKVLRMRAQLAQEGVPERRTPTAKDKDRARSWKQPLRPAFWSGAGVPPRRIRDAEGVEPNPSQLAADRVDIHTDSVPSDRRLGRHAGTV